MCGKVCGWVVGKCICMGGEVCVRVGEWVGECVQK